MIQSGWADSLSPAPLPADCYFIEIGQHSGAAESPAVTLDSVLTFSLSQNDDITAD